MLSQLSDKQRSATLLSGTASDSAINIIGLAIGLAFCILITYLYMSSHELEL